jgi:hypothetical protein
MEKFAVSDFFRIREIIAEQGIELTPDEFGKYLKEVFGEFELTDEVGIVDFLGRENEMQSEFYQIYIPAIIKLVVPLAVELFWNETIS